MCNSQTIIWEQEYKFDFRPSSTNLVLGDSDANIINIIESQDYSYFLKFNTHGEFVSKKELYSPVFLNKTGLRVPISICQTGTEYQILAGTSSSPIWKGDGDRLLPIIINTNPDGDTTIIRKQYDVNIDSNYASYGINKSSVINNTVTAENRFFNGYDKQSVEKNKFESEDNSHIIVVCYDSLGKMRWRKGYDSLGTSGEKYSLCQIKATQFKTIMLCLSQYRIDGIDWKVTRLKLLEIDYDGNVVNRFNITLNNANFTPIEVIKFDDGDYGFLNVYLDSKADNLNFIWITDPKGNIIKEVEIPHKSLKTYLEKLRLSNDGGLICLGHILMDKKKLDDYSDDIGKLYMFKMNKELELKWEYETSPDSLVNIGFNDLINFKDNEFVVTGYKNNYNYYLAKFKDLDTSVNDIDNKQKNKNIIISPNPVNDYLSIDSSIELSKIEIFSSLGLKVLETEWKEKIDVSGFSSGVYMIRIGNKINKFIKL